MRLLRRRRSRWVEVGAGEGAGEPSVPYPLASSLSFCRLFCSSTMMQAEEEAKGSPQQAHALRQQAWQLHSIDVLSLLALSCQLAGCPPTLYTRAVAAYATQLLACPTSIVTAGSQLEAALQCVAAAPAHTNVRALARALVPHVDWRSAGGTCFAVYNIAGRQLTDSEAAAASRAGGPAMLTLRVGWLLAWVHAVGLISDRALLL